jgi:hypothetical protein
MEEDRLVRRVSVRPVVWLGEKESASDVTQLGARFPATAMKERDFVLGFAKDEPRRSPR